MSLSKFALIDPVSLTILLVGPIVLGVLATDSLGSWALSLAMPASFVHIAWLWGVFERASNAVDQPPAPRATTPFWVAGGLLLLIMGSGLLAPAAFAQFQSEAERSGVEAVVNGVLVICGVTSILACHVLATKALLRAENARSVHHGAYGTFLLFLYSIVGVRLLYPRIRAIAANA